MCTWIQLLYIPEVMLWCRAVMIFHVANAWQEGKDLVKLYACCLEEVRMAFRIHDFPPEQAVFRMCQRFHHLMSERPCRLTCLE